MREARFEDHEAIVALEVAQGLRARTYEEWSNIWLRNPLYAKLGKSWPIGWVLESSAGKVVGVIGNIPLPYVFQGREIVVATGRGWAVEEQYRSFALMLMDEYFNQPRAQLFLNTTVNALAVEAFGVFGSVRVPVGDWSTAAYWITNHRGFAEAALRIKKVPAPHLLSYAAGPVVQTKDALTVRGLPRTALKVERIPSFDDRFDRFWESLRQHESILQGVRDRETLEWHFGPSLARNQTSIYVIGTAERLSAYAIFQRRDDLRFGLQRLRLVDFQALDKQDEACAAFLIRAHADCRAAKIHVLENVGCDVPKTHLFDHHAPYRRKLPGWPYYYGSPVPALEAALRDPKAWAPSSFDGDSSL